MNERDRMFIPPISIHVPAWGTTLKIRPLSSVSRISIHVPAWGTTRRTRPAATPSADFNPRSRVGNDYYQGVQWTLAEFISIHVPAWGTTSSSGKNSCFLVFQSTFPRGERLNVHAPFSLLVDFNPRSRVGNDKHPLHSFKLRSYFNPRSRVGNDCAVRKRCQRFPISIHVPAWGTTVFLNELLTS